MSADKQIYIPTLPIQGTFMEEVGGGKERVVYPGAAFSVELTAADFETPEDYHTVWINITRAVKAKLLKDANPTT